MTLDPKYVFRGQGGAVQAKSESAFEQSRQQEATRASVPVIPADPEARLNAFIALVTGIQAAYGIEIVALPGEARIVQHTGLISIEATATLGFNVNPDWKPQGG